MHTKPETESARGQSSLPGRQRGLLEHAALLLVALAVSLVLGACSAPSIDSGTGDAVEVGKAIGSGIYTKVAGISFDLDIFLQEGTGGSKTYTSGTTRIDLVDLDKSGGACGTLGDNSQVAKANPSNVVLQGLNPGSGYTNATNPSTGAYGGNNSGLRSVNSNDKEKIRYRFTVNDAVANVKVRVRAEAEYSYSCWKGIFWVINGCTATDVVTRCSNDSFTIRPAKFNIASTPTDASPQVAGVALTELKLTAVNSSGATTTGYGYTNASDRPTVTTTGPTGFKDWTTGNIPAGSWSGNFNNPASSGVVTGTNFKYTDFGQVTIPADAIVDNTFANRSGDITNSHCVANSSSNTANASGKYGCNIANQASASTPRFIPDHYEVNHVLTPACGSGGFTYLGQPFDALTLTVEAKNSDGNNMTRLTAGAPNKPTFKIEEKNAGTLLGTLTNSGSSGTVPVTLTTPEWPANGTTGGVYTNLSKATVRPSAPINHDSFALTTTLTSNLDGRSITKCNGSTVAATSSCTSSPTTKLRYGILELSDGLGAAGLPAAIRTRALYWNGTAFALNTNDSCSTIQVNDNTIARNLTGSTLTGLVPKNSSALLANGVGALLLGSQDGKTGSARIALKLGSSNNNCVSATTSGGGTLNTLDGYLGSVSCPGNYNRDPSATVSFGTLRTPYIYRSEKF